MSLPYTPCVSLIVRFLFCWSVHQTISLLICQSSINKFVHWSVYLSVGLSFSLFANWSVFVFWHVFQSVFSVSFPIHLSICLFLRMSMVCPLVCLSQCLSWKVSIRSIAPSARLRFGQTERSVGKPYGKGQLDKRMGKSTGRQTHR